MKDGSVANTKDRNAHGVIKEPCGLLPREVPLLVVHQRLMVAPGNERRWSMSKLCRRSQPFLASVSYSVIGGGGEVVHRQGSCSCRR